MAEGLVFDSSVVVDAAVALRRGAMALSASVDASADGCGSDAVERAAVDLAMRATLDLQQFQGEIAGLADQAVAAAEGIDAADAELARAAS